MKGIEVVIDRHENTALVTVTAPDGRYLERAFDRWIRPDDPRIKKMKNEVTTIGFLPAQSGASA